MRVDYKLNCVSVTQAFAGWQHYYTLLHKYSLIGAGGKFDSNKF